MSVSWMQIALYSLAFVLFCTGEAVETVKCYVCSGPGCGDPFKSKGVATKDGCTTCVKSSSNGAATSHGTSVARICSTGTGSGSGTSIGGGCETVELWNNKYAICICRTDLCNSASHVTVSMTTVMFTGLMTLVVKG